MLAAGASVLLGACLGDVDFDDVLSTSIDAGATFGTGPLDGAAQDASAGFDGALSVDGSAQGQVDAGPAPVGPGGRMTGMLEAHNRVRAMVATSPMLSSLTWSDEISRFSQEWADSLAAGGCSIMHRDGATLQGRGYGENIAMFGGSGSGASTAERAVTGWANEVQCWTYGTISGLGRQGTERCDMACTSAMSSNGCGHYTQLVWAKTREVGCGVATCSRGSTSQDVWVCNYAPGGNFVGQAPY